jgi:integral membrane protein (TIGR00529 family)
MMTLGMVLVLSRRLPLYACLFAGTALIGIWMGQGVWPVLATTWRETTAEQTLWLAGVIILILILSDLLGKSGQLERIVESFQRVSPGKRFTLAAMPALIGLLPMPGGALFSAPMIDSALSSGEVKPELKTAINYWFRHIWEYWWPLYPGIILSISLFHIESWKLVVAQSPLTVGVVIGGIIFLLSQVPRDTTVHEAASRSELRRFAREIMPILLVIIVFVGLQSILEFVTLLSGVSVPWPKYGSLVLGLLIAIALVISRNSLAGVHVRKAVLNVGIVSMVMIIFAIMSFKGMLVESHAIEEVKLELATYRIPPVIIIAILPFIAGLMPGIV